MRHRLRRRTCWLFDGLVVVVIGATFFRLDFDCSLVKLSDLSIRGLFKGPVLSRAFNAFVKCFFVNVKSITSQVKTVVSQDIRKFYPGSTHDNLLPLQPQKVLDIPLNFSHLTSRKGCKTFGIVSKMKNAVYRHANVVHKLITSVSWIICKKYMFFTF